MKIKDIFSLYNITNFIEGTVVRILEDADFNILDDYIKEQVVWRMSMCKPCVEAGACLYCTCTSPDMFYSSGKLDAQGNFAEFMEQEDWELFKEYNYNNYRTAGLIIKRDIDNPSTKLILSSSSNNAKCLEFYKTKRDYIFVDFVKYKYEINNDIIYLLVNSNLEISNFIKRKGKIETKLIDKPHNGNKKESDLIVPSNQPGELIFDTIIYDFGTVKERTIVSFEFSITNPFSTHVIIESVKASCGCIVTDEFNNITLKSKESIKIHGKLDTKNKVGDISKQVVVNVSHNTKQLSYNLTIKGTVTK